MMFHNYFLEKKKIIISGYLILIGQFQVNWDDHHEDKKKKKQYSVSRLIHLIRLFHIFYQVKVS